MCAVVLFKSEQSARWLSSAPCVCVPSPSCPQEVEVEVEDGEGSPVQLTILRDHEEKQVTVREQDEV